MSRRGVPDFLICMNGMFVALELKKSVTEVGKPSALLQEHNLNKINSARGIGIFVYPENWEKVKDTLIVLSKGDES